MPRLKMKPQTSEQSPTAQTSAQAVVNMTLVTPATECSTIQSPALLLRADLEHSLETTWDADLDTYTITGRKLPLGVTLVGMSVICAAFWYALATLIF